MDVSVVVPARNEERLIPGALASLRAQVHPPREIILVDNGCTDRTPDLARAFGARVVREERPGYYCAARRGALDARGDILAFCDADTLYPPRWLARAVRAFRDDARLQAVYGPFRSSEATSSLSGVVVRAIMSASRALGVEYTCGCNFLMRRDGYHRTGGYPDEPGRFAADIDLGNALRRFGRVAYLPGLMVRTSFRSFRRHGPGWVARTWWSVVAERRRRPS